MHLYIHEGDAHLMESFEQYLPNTVRSKEFEHYIVFICNFRNTPDQLKKLPCFGIYKQRYNYHYPTCHGSAWYRYTKDDLTAEIVNTLRNEWQLTTLQQRLGVY